MLWATRRHLHLDRVATAWLIARFIDPDPRFAFVEALDDVPHAATPFGFAGVELSSHDSEGTTFAKAMRCHRLDDDALELLERMVAEGVRHALRQDGVDDGSEVRSIAVALDGIGVGMGVLFDDDALLSV